MKTRLMILLFFVAAVLAISSSLVEANGEDTYNFYFQKAPGPTVVNQGTAGPTNPKDVVVSHGAPVVNPAAPNATPVTVGQAIAAEETPSSRWLQLSLGYSGSQAPADDGKNQGYSSAASKSAMISSGQYAAGLQWNWSENFALQAEAFYLAKPEKYNVKGEMVKSTGSPWDFGLGFVITPFRLNAGPNMKLAMSGILGGMSVPFHKSGFSQVGNPDGTPPQIAHAGSVYYGARLGFEMANRVALQATIRKISRYGATHGTASVAFLF